MLADKRYWLIFSVFVLLAVLDFVPIDFPARMIFPLLWLTLCALYLKQWALAAALFFSFLGDVMGWRNELLPQIGFFALAQITYIFIFIRLMPPKTTFSMSFRILSLAFIGLVYAVAMFWMFPRVEQPVIAYGIAVYGVLLLGMFFTTLLHQNVILILGALLFVISDCILGFHLFVQRVPHSTLSIMIPYYLGQLLLFWGSQYLYRNQKLMEK